MLQCLHPLHRLGCSGPTNAISFALPWRQGMEKPTVPSMALGYLRTELNIMHGEDAPKATAEYHRYAPFPRHLESRLDHGLALES